MFLARIEEFFGKPAVVVALAGINGKAGYSLMALSSSAYAMGFKVKDQAIVYAALPGEAILNEKNKQIAAHLGKVLLDPDYSRKPEPNECSICSGNTFKFLGDNNIECLTCHNLGKIRWDEGRPYMEIVYDPHNILGDFEARLEHRAWLMKMKEKFKEKKGILKETTAGYLKEGKWINENS